VILGTMASLLAAPTAQAITYASIDGHPNPATLILGETVTIRLDVAKAGDAVQFRVARDLNRSGKYDPTAPTVGGGSFTDGSGQDTDPEPGKIAAPHLFRTDWAAGPYVLHFEDTGSRTTLDLPGVTLVPKPEPQAISGRVLVVSEANPTGAPPPDAIVWAYDTAQKPVANANIRSDGSYTLPVPPGTYVLFAEWFGNLHSLRQVVNLVAGQQRGNVDMALLQGQEVAGTVRSGGQPMAD
jgi:hypothetical protein